MVVITVVRGSYLWIEGLFALRFIYSTEMKKFGISREVKLRLPLACIEMLPRMEHSPFALGNFSKTRASRITPRD